MGLFDALNIGAQAMLTQQAAIQVTGNNIANSTTEGYARQQVVTSSFGESHFGSGLSAGGGVLISEVRRLVDYSVLARLNDSASSMAQSQISYSTLSRVEALMNELTDTDVSDAMAKFFGEFEALANSAGDDPLRENIITAAETLISRFDYISDGLADISATLTDQLTDSVRQADELASTIAELNIEIVRGESGGGSAASLRDQREQALAELSELAQISTRETSDGAVNVYIGSEALVTGGTSRGICMSAHEVGDEGATEQMVSFKDNNGLVPLKSGKIAGLQDTRDNSMTEITERFNNLASELIWQVNNLHASGTPSIGYSSMTSTAMVEDSTVPLNSPEAKLAFTPENGSFLVAIKTTASDGIVTTKYHQVDVEFNGGGGDTTLDSLVSDLDAIPDLHAEILPSGELKLTSTNENSTFYFNDDSSGVLATLGLGTFFDGNDASNIAVNETVSNDPRYIAAGKSEDIGDGSQALEIAALLTKGLDSLSGKTLAEYHQDIVTDVAVWTSGASDAAATELVVFESLVAQRESLSGVNIDEEAVNLMNYQAAFSGAARYLSVIDELLDTVIGMI